MNAILLAAQTQTSEPNFWEFISSIGIWIWEHPVPAIMFVLGAFILKFAYGRAKDRVESTGPILAFLVELVIWIFTALSVIVVIIIITLSVKVGAWTWNSAVDAMNTDVEIRLPGDAAISTQQSSSNPNPNPNPTQPSSGGLPTAPAVCTVKSSMTATFRTQADAVSQVLAEIPSNTQLTLTEFKSSNCVDNVCWRGKTVWQSQTGWIHGAAMDCP